MFQGVTERNGRRYATYNAGGSGPTVVVLCAEGERLEDASENVLLRRVSERAPCASFAVFEGRTNDGWRSWEDAGQSSRPSGSGAQELKAILRSEGILEGFDDERPLNVSGGAFVVLASSTAVRTALHLTRVLSVGLLLLHNPCFLRLAADDAWDSTPDLGGTYAFIFSGPLADKMDIKMPPVELSEAENVYLWLSDASSAVPYVRWKPRGNAAMDVVVDGELMIMWYGRSCLVRCLRGVVRWYHISTHVLDRYLAYLEKEHTAKRGRHGLRVPQKQPADAFMLQALEILSVAARELGTGGGYPP